MQSVLKMPFLTDKLLERLGILANPWICRDKPMFVGVRDVVCVHLVDFQFVVH